MKLKKIDKLIKIKGQTIDRNAAGFTLMEVLVSIAITGILSVLISFSLGFMLSSNQKLRREQSRRVEINRALAAIADDVRTAQKINTTAASTTTQTASTAINTSHTNNNFNPALNLGTPVLYLEIPLGICTSTGVNVVDRVIYDVRIKATGDLWAGPQVLYRYGRIAGENGTIDPCSSPVDNIAIVDGIVSQAAPTCASPAILSGLTSSSATTGFYACVNSDQVTVSIFGELNKNNIYAVSEKVTTRLTN